MFKTHYRFLNYFFIGPPGSPKLKIADGLAKRINGFSHVDTNIDILEK